MEPTKTKKVRKSGLKAILGGTILASDRMIRLLPLVFFVVFLSIMMIANRYWSEGTIRQIHTVQDTLIDLKLRTITFETELLKISRPSLVIDKIKSNGLDLIEPNEPARRLNVDKIKE